MIYLDSAATTLQKPQSVAWASARAIQRLASPGRGGHRPAMAAAETAFACRQAAAEASGGSGRPARLTQAQKRVLVRLLDQEGVFRLKGSAAEVARLMGASPASVYRYLTETRRTQD